MQESLEQFCRAVAERHSDVKQCVDEMDSKAAYSTKDANLANLRAFKPRASCRNSCVSRQTQLVETCVEQKQLSNQALA